ncbi:hypothetical protein J4Q44_G00284790 [Coregonus suidteri]|uniref:Uncharacterized protein n=1 Tax=Coregonus suidteri TaxID=861788 RepID=A0AAN8QIU1_9TELE
MFQWATRSAWTRPCASHTPAAATVSQSLSDRQTCAPESTSVSTPHLLQTPEHRGDGAGKWTHHEIQNTTVMPYKKIPEEPSACLLVCECVCVRE